MPTAFGMPMQGGDSQMLDAPPPNPVQPLAPTAGMQDTRGLQGLGGASAIPSGMLPPEILAGLMQSASQIDQQLDTFAQVAPDLGAEWAQIKALLQKAMGQLLVAGGQPPSPTATGSPFPAGGLDRGGMQA